jgi:hypothetical protein
VWRQPPSGDTLQPVSLFILTFRRVCIDTTKCSCLTVLHALKTNALNLPAPVLSQQTSLFESKLAPYSSTCKTQLTCQTTSSISTSRTLTFPTNCNYVVPNNHPFLIRGTFAQQSNRNAVTRTLDYFE